MRRARYIIRVTLLLWTILNLVYLNIRTTDNIGRIAEFRFKTFDKMIDNVKNDSVYIKQKLDLLDTETTRFTGAILEGTSHVREGILYLIGTVGLFIVFEVSFLIADRKKRQTTNI